MPPAGAYGRGRCARTEYCVPDTSVSLAPSTSAAGAAARSVVCAVRSFDIYSYSLAMSSRGRAFWFRHRETLL